MLRDYLIITWLTIVAAWPWSLTVLALVLLYSIWRRHRVLMIVSALLLALVALAGWQFEHWMR